MERKYVLYDNNRLRANIPWSTAEIKAMQPEKTENNKNNENIELNRMYCVRRFYGFFAKLNFQNGVVRPIFVVHYRYGHNYRNNTCRIDDVFRVFFFFFVVLIGLKYFRVHSAMPVGAQ